MKTLNPRVRAVLIAPFALAIAMSWGAARAADIAVVNGELWTTSSEAVKKAYLVGIANTVQVESAYHGANPPSDAQSFLPRMAKGMQGQTLDGVRQGIDRWYAANPTKLKRPVLDIIWFEMVAPGLQKK